MQGFIILLLIITAAVAFAIFNSVVAKGKFKKIVISINSVLGGVIALLIIFSFSQHAIIKRDSENYDIYGGGILGYLNYDKTEDDYYIIKKNIFLSFHDDIAVPKSNAKISFITKMYSPIMVYCNKNADMYSYSSSVTINSTEYRLGDNIVRIRPNYNNLIFSAGAIGFVILFFFNGGIFLSIILKDKNIEKNIISY